MTPSFNLGYATLDAGRNNIVSNSQEGITIATAFQKATYANRKIMCVNFTIDSEDFNSEFVDIAVSGSSFKGTFKLVETTTSIIRYELEITANNVILINKTTYTK